MRKVLLFGFLGLAALMFAVLLSVSGRSTPGKRSAEVLFEGITNAAGTNFAIFQIVNHGPGPLTLWHPPRFRTETDEGSEPKSYKGTPLAVAQSKTFTVPVPAQSVKWQAGFLYDYDGWRQQLEDWGWIDREQKWAWSDWIAP